MEDFIQLKKNNILKIGIKDSDGKDTGNFLEFDLEDIELGLKLNQCQKKHNENVQNVKRQFIIIDKKQDKKGKQLLSWKEEEKIKVLKQFYKDEADALDLFLGKGGTKKLLNGRNPYWTMYDDINEMLKPILPKLKLSMDGVVDKIKAKYKSTGKEDTLK